MLSWRHAATTPCCHDVMTSCCHAVITLSCCDDVMLSCCYHDVMPSCYHAVMLLSCCHAVITSWCYHAVMWPRCYHDIMLSRCYHDVMLSCCHDCKSTFAPKARARLVKHKRHEKIHVQSIGNLFSPSQLFMSPSLPGSLTYSLGKSWSYAASSWDLLTVGFSVLIIVRLGLNC